MKKGKLLIFSLILYTTQSFATPEFAREYSVDCVTCHSMIPTLNETGKSFLRNGFRFTSDDKPTLKKIINPDKDELRPIPFSVMLNANYDTNSEDFQTKVKLYTGGTITKNLSFFGLTKDNFNSNNNNDNQELFSQKSSRFYGQLNFDGEKHVIRVGLISPLTEFGNIQKAFADSGLKGHNTTNQSDNQNSSGSQGSNSHRQKYGQNGGTQGQNSHSSGNQQNQGGSSSHQGQGGGQQQGGMGGHSNGNTHYQTPIQNSAIGNMKGVEYSYLFNNKLMALISYGESIDKGNQGANSKGNNQQQNLDDDNYQLIGGLQYKTDNGYSVGIIYNRYEKMGQDNFSILLPIEKSFDKAQLISTLVYRDETAQEDSYYGIENSLIYSITANDYIRGIIDYGLQDDEDSYGLSLTYSRAFKYMLIHLTGARKDSGKSDENLFLGSISLLF